MKRMTLTSALVMLAIVAGFSFGTRYGRSTCDAEFCLEASDATHPTGLLLDQIEPPATTDRPAYDEWLNSPWHGDQADCPKLLDLIAFEHADCKGYSGIITYEIQCDTLFKEPLLVADNRGFVPPPGTNSFNSRLDITNAPTLYR